MSQQLSSEPKRLGRFPASVRDGVATRVGHGGGGVFSDGAVPAVITVIEAARLLRVDSKTLYEAIARAEVPGAVKVGRTIRIYRDRLLDWLQGDQARVPGRR